MRAGQKRSSYTLVALGRITVHWRFEAERCEPWTHALRDRFAREKWEGVQAIRRLRAQGATWPHRMGQLDVILSPTVGHPAPKLGELASDVPYDTLLERLLRFAAYTGALNIIGAPGLSLPLGSSQARLPIGVHFAAGVGQDALLLSLGLQLEAARPWVRRAPRSAWERASA